MILVCEICTQKIATFDPAIVRRPLKGDMFDAFEPERGNQPPFHPTHYVLNFRCPWCRNLPFVANFNTVEDTDATQFPKQLRVLEGYWTIPNGLMREAGEQVKAHNLVPDGSNPSPATLNCKHCGKPYQVKHWLKKHEAKCPKKPK